MITSINKFKRILPSISMSKKKGDSGVDKGSNRDTPGESKGARPPRKEEYKNSEGKEKKNSSDKDDNKKRDEVDI